MLTLEARIETEQPARFIVRLCKHAESMGRAADHGPRVHLGGLLAHREVRVQADCSDTRGTVTFDPWGTCSMTASADTLALCIEAGDEESLRRIQDIVTRNLDRFGGRDHLAVDWRPGAHGATSAGGPSA